MNDLLHATILFTCAVNPLAFALTFLNAQRDEQTQGKPTERRLAIHAGIALGVLGVLALAHDSVLRALDVSAPTFQLGAATLLLIGAVQPLLLGRNVIALPGTWLELASPATMSAAVALAVRDGIASALAGSAIAVGLAIAATIFVSPSIDDRRLRLALLVTSRFVAALLVLLAFELGIDALESV